MSDASVNYDGGDNLPPPKEPSEKLPTDCAVKRLQRELLEMAVHPPPLCSAGLLHDDLFEWTAAIIGPPDTVYDGGVFNLSLRFPKTYPFSPPTVKFVTKIYHCNIHRSGTICLDILRKKWSPAMTVASLLVSICSLLSDCNPNDPMVDTIAQLYIKNRTQHDQQARKYTKKYAIANTQSNVS